MVIGNRQVPLRPKSFKYFAILAYHRQNAGNGWVHKEDIEAGDNQARYLYRLKNEILSALGWNWRVFDNDRHGCYRLNAEPVTISLNRNNLGLFPDFEINRLLD